MARVRVYPCTDRRDNLRTRALSSLLQPTCCGWVCEMDNGAPGGPFRYNSSPRPPTRASLRSITSAILVEPPPSTHSSVQFGKPIFSLLEDDNWWEPELPRAHGRDLAGDSYSWDRRKDQPTPEA